ncbi:MAG: hypothetical protein ASARMPRED_000352 [Alectoria sarmentosa]|nr:MAG: hypothetical protein ASARMPRED_000352 [Alectoria sarmentosa]
MARGGLSDNQRQSQVGAGYRAARNDHLTSGRVSKTTSSREGTTRKPRSTTTPYTPAEFSYSETQYFSKTDAWNAGCLIPGTKKVVFGYDFGIKDHLDAIVAAGPAYCHSLRQFKCGYSDTGNGGSLTDVSISQLAAACPNLTHISLAASIRLTDSSLLALVTKCPDLQYVEISGNDKVSGNIKGPALEQIREDASLGKKLQKLRLTDQCLSAQRFSKMLKSLSVKRKKLEIVVGDVRERGFGVNTWLGGKKKSGYQAFGGPGGFGHYGGF